MALVVKCGKCRITAAPHCPSKGCGWVTCPTHGNIRLTPGQRAQLAGDDA